MVHFNPATQCPQICAVFLLSGVMGCAEVRVVQDNDAKPIDVELIERCLLSVKIPLPTDTAVFWMGNDADLDERPRHVVQLTKPFEAMKHEVTQALYREVMGTNPSFFQACGDACPAEKVRWIEAVEFSNRLNKVLGLPICYDIKERGMVTWDDTCTGWRLPTEAEWEWMALSTAEDHPMLNKVAWFSNNSNNTTHPVCSLKPADNGLCDILGNVQEWVWDSSDAYPSSTLKNPVVDPMGPDHGSHHVFRGGAWNRYAENLTPTIRKDASYLFRNNDLGVRLVRLESEWF